MLRKFQHLFLCYLLLPCIVSTGRDAR
ncbi:RepA leader peptide Tap [Scandinavium sp.]|nr:RepA leader peptide Tap [Scandinavium sp.]